MSTPVGSGPLKSAAKPVPFKVEWSDLVVNGCSLATLKEQWAIAYHLPGATADFSPELTKQAQQAFESTKRGWADDLKAVNILLGKTVAARKADYAAKIAPAYRALASSADGQQRLVPSNFEEFEDSLRYRQYFYTEAMAIMTVEEPSRNSMSSCTVM